MYVMQIIKHTPESCPLVNDANKKIMVNMIQKMEMLTAKHGIKLVSSWTDHPTHLIYNTYETPNMDAFLKFNVEPECMAMLRFNVIETKMVDGMQDIKTMLNIK
jgi:hypothetical protein